MFNFVKRVFLGLVYSVGAVFTTNREAVVESGDGFIRYSNGTQLCWGTATLNEPATATNKRITFHRRSKAAPLLSIQRMILM